MPAKTDTKTDEKPQNEQGTPDAGADGQNPDAGANAQSGEQSGEQSAQSGEQSGEQSAQSGEQSGEQSAQSGESRKRAKRPDTSGIKADAIHGAVLAQGNLFAASLPVQERSDEQKEMDAVATQAYKEWIKRGKPNPKTAWDKCPVVMYFVEPGEEENAYRYLIRMACAAVKPEGDAPGVRVQWGNAFTLSEKMAKEIGRPDDAGKTVLGWVPVNKQVRETSNKTSANAGK